MPTSNLLPGTTHVFMDLDTYLATVFDINEWMAEQHSQERVDVFAWSADDYPDHVHLAAYLAGGFLFPNGFVPEQDKVVEWQEMLQENGASALILFAFTDVAQAALFKLTFGGVA